jgi:hypothetical protein
MPQVKPPAPEVVYTSWTIENDPLRWLECPHCGKTIICAKTSLIQRLIKWAKGLK